MKLFSLSSASLSRLIYLAAIACTLQAASRAQAANITWGAATLITADGDIQNTGTKVGAFNVGDGRSGVPSTTINGVTFDAFPVFSNNGPISTTIGNFKLDFPSRGATDNTIFGSTAAPFTSLSINYRTLLQSAAFDFNGNPFTLTMSGLTTGTNYSFQWWANDSGNSYNPVGVSATGGNSSVTLDPNTTNAGGGVGQFAIGTFTADSAQQVVTFANAGGIFPILNGFQLRSVAPVPEPSTYAMMALGLGALGLMTWKRKRGEV